MFPNFEFTWKFETSSNFPNLKHCSISIIMDLIGNKTKDSSKKAQGWD